jgi:oligopeptide transport system permease protein
MHTVPGDPFLEDQAIPEEILQALQRHYGLDKPLYMQFFTYLKDILFFDLGPSLKYQGRSVNEIIFEGFPVSFMLGMESLTIAIIGGLSLGSLASFYHLRLQDKFILSFLVLGISIPSFILGTFLQYIFAIKLDLFPVARWGTLSHTILPSFTLALFPMVFIARLTRSNMIEVLQQDYILTARAKGLSYPMIIWRHTIRNAIIPVVAYLGPLIATILTGSFVVEKIFGIPGLGQWYVISITHRDYTVIMGTTIFYSALLMLCIFISDCLYCWIDPRIHEH